jgi:4-hydroxy-2-oxoglutarate aldolase
MLNLNGILPPLTTPFNDRGNLDLDALARNLEFYNRTRLVGYVAFGSNGEAPHLTAAERRQVVELLHRKTASGRTVVAGINELSTRAAIRAVEEAADAGAQAALVITPYFYKGAMDGAALTVFFKEVADAATIPLLLYNVPQNTGVHLSPATVAELATHPNIAGVKDSSGNLAALVEIIQRTPPDFQVMVGNAGILYSALAMGATGAILAVACLAPTVCVEIYRAVVAGEHEKARDLQFKQAPVAKMVTADYGVAGLKAALDLAGLQGGVPRSPLLPLAEAAGQRLKMVMEKSGLFPPSH